MKITCNKKKKRRVNVSVRLFPNINCIILRMIFIEHFWYCTELGLVNKTKMSQVGGKGAGHLQLKNSERVTSHFSEALAWVA